MQLSDVIAKRKSVRSFTSAPIDKNTVIEILEAGRSAPSACNIQPWQFIVFQGIENTEKLRTVYSKDWFIQAPVIICVAIDTTVAWRRMDNVSYGFVDAAIAMDHMILKATELGLGTCWIGAFDAREAKNVLNLPANIEPVVFTPLGYPEKDPVPRGRKPLDEIVRWNGL